MSFAVNPSSSNSPIRSNVNPQNNVFSSESSFDKILDSKVERKLEENRRNEQDKNKHVSDKRHVSEKRSQGLKEKEVHNEEDPSIKSKDKERLDKIKKLANKIKDDDFLDEKKIKDLKNELDNLIEELLASEGQLALEELNELYISLEEVSSAFTELETKLLKVIANLESDDSKNTDLISSPNSNELLEGLKQMLDDIKVLNSSISEFEDIMTQNLKDGSGTSTKDELLELLSKLSDEIGQTSEASQKILENSPELLKEISKVADKNNVEAEALKVNSEADNESDLESATIKLSESSREANNSTKDDNEGLTNIFTKDTKATDEGIKSDEMLDQKNLEILKFENTLIRSARVNNPLRAQAFEKNIMNQVINHTTSNLSILENGSEMILKLYPKNLGEVAVKLAIEKGVILAEFNVESQSVKEVLESNLSDLRTALQNKGFLLEGLDVSVGDNNSNNSSRNFSSQARSKSKFFDILEVEEESINQKSSDNSTTIDTLK